MENSRIPPPNGMTLKVAAAADAAADSEAAADAIATAEGTEGADLQKRTEKTPSFSRLHSSRSIVHFMNCRRQSQK